MSIDTRLIFERLDRAEIGDVVTYDELSEIIGRDLGECYHLTGTARKRLLGNKKYFEAVPGVGFRRCNDSEKVAAGGNQLTKSRRACRRCVRITTSVDDWDAMTKEDRTRHNIQAATAGCIAGLTSQRRLKAIESRVSNEPEPIPQKAVLDAIAASIRKPKARKTNGAIEEQSPTEPT